MTDNEYTVEDLEGGYKRITFTITGLRLRVTDEVYTMYWDDIRQLLAHGDEEVSGNDSSPE